MAPARVTASSLRSPAVQRVLADLTRLAQAEDPPAIERRRAHEAALGRRVYGRERGAAYGLAPLSITPEVGELLYVLTLTRGAQTIVEFGASLGFSTIHLAAAARDLPGARVITTELEPDKARIARRHLAEAGLEDLVEVREGDAMETLGDVTAIDLLFLDGWNNLYVPLLERLEPRLSPRALVIADLSVDDPELEGYVRRMHEPAGSYVTVDVPLDAGVVVSVHA